MPRKLLLIFLKFLAAFIFASLGHAQTHALDGEFITEWLLLGPFTPNALDRDFLASVGGEANVHPKEGDTVIIAPGDTLRWKSHRSIGSLIDLDRAIGDFDSVTAYAFCILQSGAEQKVQILLGSNDEVAVWINDRQVFSHAGLRDLLADEDTLAVDLKAGANRCLVKVTEPVGTWGFAMRAFPFGQPVAVTPKIGWWASSMEIENKARWWLGFNWKYHPGDNSQWAAPEFDDRSWKTVRSVVPPQQWPEDWRGIGWYRLHLSVDSTLWNRPLAMSVWQWGASEIYLDGKLLAQYGKVGSSITDEDGYAVLNPDLPPPQAIVFDQSTDHVLAVRYSNFFLMQKAPNILHGFVIELRDLNDAIAHNAAQRQTNTYILIITTAVPIVFAVLHLLLFLFYHRAKQNLYYAILTLTIGVMAFCGFQYGFSFVTDLRRAFLYKNLGQILSLFSALAGLRFLYAIFYPKLPKQFWLFLFMYIAVLIWLWDHPFRSEDYANGFAATTILEMLRIVVVVILKKKDGAWIFGAGALFLVLFGSSVVLTGIGILPAGLWFEVTLPVIGIFGFLLSMSVYLAWDFARTNKSLEAQLMQVRELSEKTLQQELERAQLKHELELEHLQAEKLQEIDRMKSRFFANISHEFRTPLTLILGPLENLLSENFREPVKKQFRVMLRNGRRLLRLINQLLDLARLEAGSMSLKARPENIVQLLKGIVLSFSSLAERKQITLKFEAPEESLITYVDRDKLEKIVSNLLSNAFKFTPEGGAVAVEAISDWGLGNADFGTTQQSAIRNLKSEIAEHQEFVEIRVKDTGIGIPPDKLEKIFDRFYQADDSYTREQEGSGIGLALTKELVELHRGEIRVTSELGRGSTFIVRLPLGREHLKPEEFVEAGDQSSVISEQSSVNSEQSSVNSEQLSVTSDQLSVTSDQSPVFSELQPTSDQQQATSIQDQASSIEQPVLLIVEDNADVRTYIRDYLDKDYRIIEAVDGEEGFEKSARAIPDLIISDVMMPKMDGYELCRKLKTDERTSHIPVILLTARAGGESKVEGLETGADDYIIKPFDARELQVRVKNLIEQRRKLRERFRQEITLQPKAIAITSMDEQFLQKAMAAVEQNLSDPEFSTDEFARRVAMSRMQLHRKLRALTDQSTHEFIRTYRLQRAAQFLQNRAGNVTEICYDVGFNSLSHFAKAFREQFGQSPSEFAEAHSQQGEG